MHRVLILGAGYCVPSMLKYLVNHGIFVVLASRTPSSAQKLCVGLESMTQAIQLDIETEAGTRVLEEVTPTVDIIVSMVPYAFHPKAAAIAIKHKKHFFTSSYVSDAMRALNQSAKDAGVILLNECGVNPGINHMTAMRVIHKAQANGGVITEFTEKVGGLRTPEFNNNPFGYKFSWAPRGVLLAALNSAKYLQDGKEVDVDGKVLFDTYKVDPIPELGISLEWHPNRNSIPYMTQYGIQNTCKTMIRGTYRHMGWCSKIKKLVELKYLSLEETLPKIRETASPLTYAKLMAHFTQAPAGADLKQHTAKVLGLSASDSIIEAYEWLGLFGEEVVPEAVKSPLDALCHVMKEKLAFAPDEVDMIVCRQTFTIQYPSTGKTEHATSTLIDFGIKNGDSCMSRTVGLPLAIAIRMTFEGKLSGLTGLISPTLPELYNPLLAELDSLGIKVVDASSSA